MHWFKSITLFATLSAIFILVPLIGEIHGASSCVGTVRKIAGTATILRQGNPHPASVGQEIYENDTLQTGPDGSMGVVLNDDTFLSLGPNSALMVDKFLFAPKQGKFSVVLKILKGTAAYLSGLISKLSPESVRVETPSASIGIRGTRFVVKVEER